MAKVTIKEWYARVNATWPAEVPALTADEAVKAAKKLYRFALGSTYSGKVIVTSGNRYSYLRYGVLYINPSWGWESDRGLVHLLSHAFHRRLSSERPHGGTHARLEIRMIKEVIKRGWLDGALRTAPKPAKVAPRKPDSAVKLARTEAAIDRWEKKLRRAENALKKLRRRQAYYSKRTAVTSATVH